MPNCGIKKYDELPGRVGWVDVDAIRYALLNSQDKIKKWKKKEKYFKDKLNKLIKANKK